MKMMTDWQGVKQQALLLALFTFLSNIKYGTNRVSYI
jgi:hypothetical protein